MSLTRRSAVENHYRKIWNAEPLVCEFSGGPIDQLPRDFKVIKFQPTEDRNMWAYATCCMSQGEDSKAVELHMFSPYETDSVVELLFVTAHYHRTVARLDLGHSVNFGRPWIPDAHCEYGLVSLPYLDGPRLETLKSRSDETHFYWLLPVTKSEIEFKKTNSLEALEARFDKVGLKYLSPDRQSVA